MDARRNMSIFSLVMGILSLIMLLFGLGIPFAALGLILALLSRGGGAMLPRARAGLATSVVGLVLGIAIAASSVFLLRSGALSDYYDTFQNMLETDGGAEDAEKIQKQLRELFGVTETPAKGGQLR